LIVLAYYILDYIAFLSRNHERLLKLTPALSGFFCFVLSLAALLVVLRKSFVLMRTPPPSNIGRAVGFLLAGIVLVDALAVCNIAPATALVFALGFPFLLMWQRKIAAT